MTPLRREQLRKELATLDAWLAPQQIDLLAPVVYRAAKRLA